jgi:hypothetical protein
LNRDDRRLSVPKYRHALPQLDGDLYLTDGGIETTLIFHDGLDLPHFAAFDLLKDGAGRETLKRYFRTHASIAKAYGVGFILESAWPRPTASPSRSWKRCAQSLRVSSRTTRPRW